MKDLGAVDYDPTDEYLMMRGDPLRNIKALADVRYTIRGGKIVYPNDRDA